MSKKKKTILVKLLSTAKTGFFYVTSKNTMNVTRKLMFNKYDPMVGRHVLFQEAKLKSGK
jgi:large subunit ribosomal protein L33